MMLPAILLDFLELVLVEDANVACDRCLLGLLQTDIVMQIS
jgi:hypothetical protein